MRIYTVITGDIIDSRKNNATAFEGLEEKLDNFNYPHEMITPFKILKGDEIQGVLKGFLPAPQIIRRLRYCFYPLRLRIGIGIGEIEKGLEKDNSWQMNGPAFYLARNALEQIENSNGLTRINSTSKGLDTTLNTIFLLMDTIQQDWTENQWEAIHIYEEMGTYSKAAEKLGIAFQNVEKRCSAASWKQVEQAENNIGKIIKLWRE